MSVLILAGDMAEALEIFYPYFRLREEGFTVHVAAPTKKPIQTVVHDREPGYETYTEKPGYRFIWVDKAFSEVNPEEYDGLIIPGGRAPEYIRNYPEIRKILEHFFNTNKPVGALCHGLLVLNAYGFLKGRKVTSTIGAKMDLIVGGAEWVDAEVVIDGNLVTSRTWRDLHAFMREFIKKLKEWLKAKTRT
ncbi:MAG: DJ-1/PfpI family protein [Candidatus Njordarchaeales archaeon]